MRKVELVILALVLLPFLVGVYFYPQLPEEVASHWNAQGQVNGYMPKFWGLFLMPFISVALFLLFVLIPKIDPLKANIKKFISYYDAFVFLLMVFLFYLYLLTIFWNMGARFDMIKFLLPTLGILFYYIGILMEHVKRNWFIGIRTPWTISNEKVWNKTHRLGGKLFRIIGITALIGFFFRGFEIFFVIIPVIAVVSYLVTYSYFEYKKINRRK